MEKSSDIPELIGMELPAELKPREMPPMPSTRTPEEQEKHRALVQEFSAALSNAIESVNTSTPQTLAARMKVVPHGANSIKVGYTFDTIKDPSSSRLYYPFSITFYPDSIWIHDRDTQYESEFPLDHKEAAMQYLSTLITQYDKYNHGYYPRMGEHPFGNRDEPAPGEKVVYGSEWYAREAARVLFERTNKPVSVEYRTFNRDDIEPDDYYYKDENVIHKLTLGKEDGAMYTATDEDDWVKTYHDDRFSKAYFTARQAVEDNPPRVYESRHDAMRAADSEWDRTGKRVTAFYIDREGARSDEELKETHTYTRPGQDEAKG